VKWPVNTVHLGWRGGGSGEEVREVRRLRLQGDNRIKREEFILRKNQIEAIRVFQVLATKGC
jgi:hypothetical protein